MRLVLSYFQSQALERQALTNMASLLEEDASKEAKASGASKRKLKKDRQKERAKSMAENAEEEIQEVPWEESQELSLLRQMGWEKVALETQGGTICGSCGPPPTPPPPAPTAAPRRRAGGAAAASSAGADAAGGSVDAAASDAAAEADAAELRTKLQLQEEELNDDDLEQAKADMLAAKAGLLEERERMREALKAKFDAYAHGKKK